MRALVLAALLATYSFGAPAEIVVQRGEVTAGDAAGRRARRLHVGDRATFQRGVVHSIMTTAVAIVVIRTRAPIPGCREPGAPAPASSSC